MLIEAVKSPLEVLLALQVFDNDGKQIPRVVCLDTDKLEAKQLLVAGGKLVFKYVKASRFCFVAQTSVTADSLRSFLSEELHDRIVLAASKDSE